MSSLSWDNLKYSLQPWIRTAVEAMGFETMTPVQASTIPHFCANKDVVVNSYTGSGKTISFVIPVLERLIKECGYKGNENSGDDIDKKMKPLPRGQFHTLIVAPTRELSNQISKVFEKFIEFYPYNNDIKTLLLVGGDSKQSVQEDVQLFLDTNASILIGTPGRVLDFLSSSKVSCKACGCVVLDEADRLLDVSFIKDVESILSFLPKQRRTGLFSATIDSAGMNIFKTGMRNPIKINVKPSVNNNGSKTSKPSSLAISYIVLKPELKLKALLTLLFKYKYKKVIVYFPTCQAVTYFYSMIQHILQILRENGGDDSVQPPDDLKFFSLHGKLSTNSRVKTLRQFEETLLKCCLLTTDVAARGIDIPDVDLVVQMDPPTDTDIFLHRCGRTGRANNSGRAIFMLNEGREEDYIPFLAVKNIEVEELENFTIDENLYDLESIHSWILQDRSRFDESVKTYVGFIKYYSRHSASSIFRLQSMDYINLAKLHGLIRLPKMPEITKYLDITMNVSNRQLMENGGWLIANPVNMNKYAYSDRQREKKRLKELQELSAVRDKNKLKRELKKKNLAWSNKTETKEKKLERKQKLSIKRKAIEERIKLEETKVQEYNDDDEVDWKDLIQAKKRQKNSNNNSEVQGTFDDL
ncbi:related to ATP-dependent rRNA helicase SPB4 [Saccharomycodes ludwigii]|uniref:ATP-dependent RNA helicase n=1 Tax=Saccharomycodes ludwigii TaxID=36035 RepID=A0A376BBZ9_9ASCO|nr:hypothetical protein SCDLUD_000592 [Saccharomycodes ludwigii]KAH3902989.1 hypothetical protein SCDLUD_000592 [Saccharomycodes ludwigii]SSD61650.1 related to ATP-dependent rRNA helicase SPB4 [Saccharomycodes ludwigii]